MSKKDSFISDVMSFFGGAGETIDPAPGQEFVLSGKSLRIPCQDKPCVLELEFGKQTLQLYPDLPLEPSARGLPYDFLIFDPRRCEAEIGPFLRLGPGRKLSIDRHSDELPQGVITEPDELAGRHISIRHKGDFLTVREPIGERECRLSSVDADYDHAPFTLRRRSALEKVKRAYGGPLDILPATEALETLRQVNQLLRDEAFRPRDSKGEPGALLDLPEDVTPILVGDLHARVDNLLEILSENRFLESMEEGRAAMVLLGDMVHSEEPDTLEEMDSSILMMDLIMKLKLRFPRSFFFLMGNHDSFCPDVMKGDVPQSLLWDERVRELRGETFRDGLVAFYERLPLVAKSPSFIACHASPPMKKVSLNKLINAREHPKLVRRLTRNRLQTAHFPEGYTKKHVRKFRDTLELAPDFPFIVAHYPLSADKTIWLEAGKVPAHHVLYSARAEDVGSITWIDGQMTPLIYKAERLTSLISS